MKLGFDIDGITCDMGKAMVEYINKEFDLDHTIGVFKNHALNNNNYVDDSTLNEEIVKAMRKEVIESPKALIEMYAFEDASAALRKLSKLGHTIHHITSRDKELHGATVDWLRKNSIPFDTLHVIGHTSKGRVGRSLNLDFYMDDCIWHLADMYRYKNRWRKGLALFTQPWNINESVDASKYFRFDNWPAIIRHLGIHKR